MADGSTIYPSATLEPTPRYDDGTLFANGQDPIRKDVLEMMFRLCDRQAAQLIPAMHFATPLPELEQLKRRGGGEAARAGADRPQRRHLAANARPRRRPGA